MEVRLRSGRPYASSQCEMSFELRCSFSKTTTATHSQKVGHTNLQSREYLPLNDPAKAHNNRFFSLVSVLQNK
ncbi:hypothetical protein ANCCAN_04908 [Ancylostoma caninum]|uniref:Uncharacterized protein n=1 Tax=Ancylostoma caninum TaxID=29170 RepID=A0A368GXF4_ANCCA|nr:hypothetical protein ANCCAN_04908 [Ancylostoma caninum]